MLYKIDLLVQCPGRQGGGLDKGTTRYENLAIYLAFESQNQDQRPATAAPQSSRPATGMA